MSGGIEERQKIMISAVQHEEGATASQVVQPVEMGGSSNSAADSQGDGDKPPPDNETGTAAGSKKGKKKRKSRGSKDEIYNPRGSGKEKASKNERTIAHLKKKKKHSE